MNIYSEEVVSSLKVKIFFIFLFLSIFTYIILNIISNNSKEYYLNEITLDYERAYNSIYNQQKELADVFYLGLKKITNLHDIFNNIQNKSNENLKNTRRLLYLDTYENFKTLKSKNLENISYILPNDKIFLQMKRPNIYGKKADEKKILLQSAKRLKKPISGYEIDNEGGGFRFIYPIIENNTYLGAVDLTFNERALTSSIFNQFNVLSNFIIAASYFDKDFLKNSKKYVSSKFKGFIHNSLILKDLEKSLKKKTLLANKEDLTNKKIYTKAMNKISHSNFIKSKNIIISTIPVIHPILKEQKAFLAIFSKGDTIKEIDRTNLIIFLLFEILYTSIALILYQKNYKNIIEKRNLNEIIKKDKQILEQAKLAQMGEMIANIAHQWRQPLSTISTAASGLKIKEEFNLLEKNDITKYTDTIVKNTQYLSETIETFRNFIKEENDKKEIILQNRVDKTIKIVQASMENHHIKLVNKIDHSIPIKVNIIAEELSQVLINIFNNAKDALIDRKIKNAKIEVDIKKLRDNIFITIEDNAQGIPKEILSKIYEPYFTTKHKSQGTGLGLYMSKIIVEKHLNGQLYVDNTKKGAKFTIKLNI